jgi:hypothetical protein
MGLKHPDSRAARKPRAKKPVRFAIFIDISLKIIPAKRVKTDEKGRFSEAGRG